MAISSELASLMESSVIIYPATAVDQYGARTVSASGTTYQAHVQPESSLARDDMGREVTIVATVIIYGVATVTTNDRITLPDGSSPVIVSISQHRDPSGPHHTTLRLGR